MLQSIRNNAQGIVVWVIVGLIIITFALFGLGSYLSGSSQNIAASVNGQDISENDLLRAYRNYQDRLMKMFGDSYRPEMFNEAMLKQNVLQGMINETVLDQMMRDERITASSNLVRKQIEQTEAFQEEGRFSASQYKRLVSLQGMSPAQFEHNLARDIAASQLQSGIRATAFVTASEQKRLYELKAQEREVAYLLIKRDDFKQQVVTDAEVASHYESNQPQYMKPEQVNLEYLELDLKQMAGRISISEDEIAQHYEENSAAYRKDDEEGARKLLNDLRKKALSGTDFAALAEKHSIDPGSAKQGGDLGFFPRGVMVKPFEDAVFSMKVGQISEPIKTSHGFHLIKLEEIKKGDPEERRARHILIKAKPEVQPLEAVADNIRKEMQLARAEENFYKQADQLNDLVYSSDSLQPAADALGLQVKESGYITRRGSAGLFAAPKLASAAFSENVMSGKNSEPVEVSETHIVVVRKKEYQPASPRPLDEVKATIRQQLVAKKASEASRQLAAEMLVRLQKGEAREEVQKAHATASWHESGFVSRTARTETVPTAVRDRAFSMSWNAEKAEVLWAQTELAGGDQALVVLKGVRTPEMKEEEARRQAVQLENALGNSAYQAMVTSLRDKASVTIVKKEE